ncbi:MAG: RHS repeat-associated core domain-containing protein, partial [Lentisphaerae bacterium]|nr:RHS repeat-associated core domain-containing protein [Lentisphaerota bacterium]
MKHCKDNEAMPKVAIAGTTTRHYYDDQRVAVQTLVSGGVETDDRYFVFGNYIDEVLVMGYRYSTSWIDFYYGHDHLYSPVALFAANGTVAERYEYDAYGQVQVLAPNYELRTTSLYANAYSFTGRELDTLDAGNCTLMHYRHRAYNPEIGRFMQQDPFGTASISSHKNKINVLSQYHDGLSLYQYAIGNPVMNADPHGLWCIGVANPFTPGITVMPPPPVLAFPLS